MAAAKAPVHGRIHRPGGSDVVPVGDWWYATPVAPATTPDDYRAARTTAFLNGWVNVALPDSSYSPLRFRMTNQGRVEIVGAIDGGVLGTACITLPELFRPEHDVNAVISDINGATILAVLISADTGDVVVTGVLAVGEGTITTTKLADGSVTTAKIADGAVTSDKITGPLDTQARVGVRKNSAGSTFLRRRLNLIEGSGVTLTVADDSGNEEVDVTIASAGGAPSGSAGGALDGSYPNPGLAASVAGNGLAETSDVLSVNVDNSSIEISSDILRVKALGVTEAMLGLSDNTTADVSTSKHGLTPKAPNDTGKFLRGDGTWAAVGGVTTVIATDVFWDAKGDLAGGTGADAASRLPVGSNGKILVAASGETTGLKWDTGYLGGLELVYKYTVTGSDKATIDTGADTADAGTGDWTNGDVLEIYLICRSDDAGATAALNLTVNNDTGNNYDLMRVTGANVTASANNALAQAQWSVGIHGSGGSSNYPQSFFITIPGYADTVFNKVGQMLEARNDATAGTNEIDARAMGWRSTAAITRFKVDPATGNLKVGSKLIIYKRRFV